MNLKHREMKISDLPATFSVRLSTIENAITMEKLPEVHGITPKSVVTAMKSHDKRLAMRSWRKGHWVRDGGPLDRQTNE